MKFLSVLTVLALSAALISTMVLSVFLLDQPSLVNTTDIKWQGKFYRYLGTKFPTPPPPATTAKITLNVDLGNLGPRTQACVTRIYVAVDGHGGFVTAEKPVTKLVYEVTRGAQHSFSLTPEHKYADQSATGEISRGLFYSRISLRAVGDQELTVYFDSPQLADLDLLGEICSK